MFAERPADGFADTAQKRTQPLLCPPLCRLRRRRCRNDGGHTPKRLINPPAGGGARAQRGRGRGEGGGKRQSDRRERQAFPTEQHPRANKLWPVGRKADGVSRHRTNNSAASGYLRAVYRLLKVGGVARGSTFGSG